MSDDDDYKVTKISKKKDGLGYVEIPIKKETAKDPGITQ